MKKKGKLFNIANTHALFYDELLAVAEISADSLSAWLFGVMPCHICSYLHLI
jgi:hypothetical protein